MFASALSSCWRRRTGSCGRQSSSCRRHGQSWWILTKRVGGGGGDFTSFTEAWLICLVIPICSLFNLDFYPCWEFTPCIDLQERNLKVDEKFPNDNFPKWEELLMVLWGPLGARNFEHPPNKRDGQETETSPAQYLISYYVYLVCAARRERTPQKVRLLIPNRTCRGSRLSIFGMVLNGEISHPRDDIFLISRILSDPYGKFDPGCEKGCGQAPGIWANQMRPYK